MKKNLSSKAAHQRERLLAYLLAHNSINTQEGRLLLDIFHVGARVYELRGLGHVAKYVLLAGGGDDK